MDQIWPSARVGRGDNKAYICTLFGEEDEKLVVTYKTSFKSVNGSSLVIDGENIESNNIPVVTGADILHARQFVASRQVAATQIFGNKGKV